MAEIFNDDVAIHGDENTTQLEVRGHMTQTEPLQTWADSAGDALVQVTGDGRLHVGQVGTETPDALIEAHREDDPLLPQRGIHTLGQIGGEIADGVAWAVHELELLGAGGVEGVHSAVRAQISQQNSGDATAANVRAGEFTAANFGGGMTDPVGQATGIQVEVTNAQNAHLAEAVGVQIAMQQEDGGSGAVDTAYGLRVEDIEAGIENYAIQTGKGLVHLGDTVELQRPASVPGTPDTDTMRLYPKSDGKLYAKNWNGDEYDLTQSGGSGGSGSVSSVGLVMPAEFFVSGSPVTASGDLTVSKANQNANTIFAGPSNGAAAVPGFRALQAADLPAHSHAAADIASGTLPVANGGTGAANAADARTNLGLGTLATQAANDVDITGGSVVANDRLEIVKSSGYTELAIKGPAGENRQLLFGSDDDARWGINATSTAEEGSNAGTDLGIARFSDAGTFIDFPLLITRADGVVHLDSVDISGGSITGITDLAVADGGTGASNMADARTNLGLGALATKSSINTTDITDDAVTLAKLAHGTASKLIGYNASGIPSEINLPGSEAYIRIADKKSSGTNGGTFTNGAWRTRDLNTESSDVGGHATLASNQITLAAGTYRFQVSAPGYRVDWHQIKLRNVTDGTDVEIGTSEYSDASAPYAQTRSFCSGRFTINASKVFEVQHRGASSFGTYGFGLAAGFGDEVYTVAEFWKEA